MAQIVIDQLDEATVARLTDLAAANHISLEEQAKQLLIDAVEKVDRRNWRLEMADRIAAMTPKGVVQTDSTIQIREDRDR
jgi:plasmid stability protein